MERLQRAMAEMQIPYTESTIEQFSRYMQGILEWNEKINLTAITEREEFIEKHFLDSILCADSEEMKSARKIIDVGTGAGFPGIPLAIIFPDKHFVLMDSLKKRLKVIDALCLDLNIQNVVTIHARAEELARQKAHWQQYDLCVSRAVANLSILCEYCLPFVSKGGYFLSYKGPDAEHELAVAQNAIRLLGGGPYKLYSAHEKANLPFTLAHKIISIQKIKDTPSKYPRKAGIPSKEPLK